MKTDTPEQEALLRRIPRQPARLTGELWCITTYFNPAGYSNKVDNLRLFAEGLRKQGAKLLIVELAFGEAPYVLGEDLADRVVRVRSNCVMWQKERLLNIAVEELPDICDKVAWIDADMLFENGGWMEETNELLQEYVVVQPFHRAWYLPRDYQEFPASSSALDAHPGVGTLYGAAYNRVHNPGETMITGAPGHAWAARRSLLKVHGFYDRSIMGGGDAVATIAMFGYIELEPIRIALAACKTQRHMADIQKWMERFYADVKGSVFYAQQSVFHLWHGERENRQFNTRATILQDADFDPQADISLDGNRCWQWSSEKPELHRRVREYFWNRKEDAAS